MRTPPGPILLLIAILLSLCATSAFGAKPDAAGPSTVVQPGDTWERVRARMFSIEGLQRANPGLGEILHPGETVRAPYVRVRELDREREARVAAESKLAESQNRLAGVEAERVSLEAQRRKLAGAQTALTSMRLAMIGLVVLAVVLLAFVGVLIQAARAARSEAADATGRYGFLEERYNSLRRSLQEIESGLQRRVVALLHLHGGKVISEKELETGTRAVLEFTRDLKKKHESP